MSADEKWEGEDGRSWTSSSNEVEFLGQKT
jgi:hypothetical protein